MTIYVCIRKLLKTLKKTEKQEKIIYFKCLDGHVVKSKGGRKFSSS